ncbi:hypothetical protein L210DRAFT_3521158 [Boletus edulis BED1]|uniref:GAR domain-containing protein n=1 Tax=Boletus edulis BED1 TaxID=1328754 RepID=A0AAD4C729_BOLED|nr:hypothetical protein L210DRAFT_3521158 [Boletus edulis BED1]
MASPEVSEIAFTGAKSNDTPLNPGDTEKQTLESHEVIELQAFSERKAWIEDKIKFLEQLPPIQVFVGADAVRTSADPVPGLPSREQLQEWLAEHDKIEKETEIFDSGELKKLRKFTKAATQRHLSPEDTDLIELTLTAIYELDKLLHLLRDRSEHLDLLGVRLSWEEHRAAAWADLKKLLADIETLLATRARWSSSIYEAMAKHEERPSPRRGSIASMASDTSTTFGAGFSRTARFRLAELLSRDAAQFAGKASSLRHGKIAVAGKALDKLIDNSRKPVPEELLDEQDRLEEKGIHEMENVGKFVMDTVMQWRKADELYVETMKDQNAAQNLLEEIETAKLYHPTSRQSSSFTSRVDTLVKRLALRGDPMSSPGILPQPTHPLFPDQLSFNDALVQNLSTEIASAVELVTKVDSLAKEYRANYEAVREVDLVSQSTNELLLKFNSIIDRLSNGISTYDGDGSPPDLSSEACLQPTMHATYLALLPALLEEAEEAMSTANKLVSTYQIALLNLERPGIDLSFKQRAAIQLNTMVVARDRLGLLVNDTHTRVGRLRVVRKVWSVMDESLKVLQNIQSAVGETMEREKWKPQERIGAEPMTPETPRSRILDPIVPSLDMPKRLDIVRETLSHDVAIPLASLSGSLETSLDTFLAQTYGGLMSRLENVNQTLQLLDAVRAQSEAMASLREEVNELQIRIEDLGIRYDAAIEEALSGDLPPERISEIYSELQVDTYSLCDAVKIFANSVVHRVPLVAPSPRDKVSTTFVRKTFSSTDARLGASTSPLAVELPFSLNSLDDSVRADSNFLVMRLTGESESLHRKADHFQLARMARDIDTAISSATRDLREVAQELESLWISFTSMPQADSELQNLQELSRAVEEHCAQHRSRLARSLSLIRESIRHMESVPASRDLHLYETLLSSRRRGVDDLEIKVNSWGDRVAVVRGKISEALLLESQRLEVLCIQREQAAEEKRQQEERERSVPRDKLTLEAHELIREPAEDEGIVACHEEQANMEIQEAPLKAQERQEEVQMVSITPRESEECRRNEAGAKAMPEGRDIRTTECKQAEAVEPQEVPRKELASEPVQDVFGLRVAPSPSPTKGQGKDELLDKIVALRKGLRSININEVARPTVTSSFVAQLPTLEDYGKMNARFSTIISAFASLPSSAPLPTAALEFRSLKSELDASQELMQRIRQLADLAGIVHKCDMALSDLLEHIDSYPAAPAGPLSSTHVSTPRLPPEEQLSARIGFTRRMLAHVTTYLEPTNNDPRAVSEYQRVQQTWLELEDMANDRIAGKRSRSSSIVSSGRNSRASVSAVSSYSGGSNRLNNSRLSHGGKAGRYSNLSVGGSDGNKFLAPNYPPSRRALSSSSNAHRRSSSKLSMASVDTTRSVSGPVASASPAFSSSIHNPTFASRQRTASMSSGVSSPALTPSLTARRRAQTRSRGSPTPSEMSSNSRTNPTRSSSSLSTWARAPRQSFPVANRNQTPPRRTQPAPKKAYVANPKNKLDVAVGDVVNKLPVNINVEVVADTWKDQSGKYWIGDQEPKLCFCRILRSQTVMVRVGGGWQELSKFIQGHFADQFRIMPPESPQFGSPRFGSREEKWISSATLFETSEIVGTPPPRTPEPSGPFIPSFTLSTPSARSPMKSSPSSGSPLAPLQFMRRANPDGPPIRPITPSKPPTHRSRTSILNTPARHAWRP